MLFGTQPKLQTMQIQLKAAKILRAEHNQNQNTFIHPTEGKCKRVLRVFVLKPITNTTENNLKLPLKHNDVNLVHSPGKIYFCTFIFSGFN